MEIEMFENRQIEEKNGQIVVLYGRRGINDGETYWFEDVGFTLWVKKEGDIYRVLKRSYSVSHMNFNGEEKISEFKGDWIEEVAKTTTRKGAEAIMKVFAEYGLD